MFIDSRNKRRKIQRKKKRSKKLRDNAFELYPSAPLDWKKLPRLALIEKSRGGMRKYYLDSLSNYELENFWRMNKDEKANYLDDFFDCHHREPRCQKGKTIPSNLSYVEKKAHKEYNKFIFVVSELSKISIESVKTKHIGKFLHDVYPTLLRIYMHQSTCKMKSLPDVTRRSDYQFANDTLITCVAKWAGLSFREVRASDVVHFIDYLHPVLRKLAVDHKTNKLMTLGGLVELLNRVWLPADMPIVLTSFKRK